MLDPPYWLFDVATADNDAVKVGVLVQCWSRVVVSREDYPSIAKAADLAGCIASTIHGGMPTTIRYIE